MTIKVVDQNYFDSVMAFAKERGLQNQLQEKLDWLGNYAGEGKTTCCLYKDFAPYSFEFVMMKGDERWFNGGLIYFGRGDTGVGMPQLSVRIGDTDEGWSVHT